MNNIRTFATYANRYLVKHAKAFPLKAIILLRNQDPYGKFL